MAVKELIIKIFGDSKDAEHALGRVGSAAHSIGKVMAVGLAAATAAVGGLVVEMKKATEAAAVQEKAEKMLAEAMKQHGTYTDEAFKSLKDFAGAQQKLTTFGDEVTLSAMQQMQTFGMDTETMKKATVAAQDLAAAKGIDLNTAAQLVGKAFAGNTGTMGRYGIVLDQARLQAEGFDYVLSELNANFGGQAQAAAATYEGRLAQMKNAFGDLQETIGMAMIPSLSLLMESLRDVFAGWQDSGALQNLLTPLGDAFAKLAPLLGEALTGILEAIGGSGVFETITSLITSALELIIPIIQQIGPPIMEVFNALFSIASIIGSALAPVIQTLAPVIGEIVSMVAGFFVQASPFIEQTVTLLAQIFNEILSAMAPVLTELLDAILQIAAAILPIIPIIVEAMLPVIQAILPVVASVIQTIADIISGLAPTIQQLAPIIGKILSLLGDLLSRIFERMQPVIERLLEMAARLIEALLPVAIPILELLLKILEPIFALLDKFLPVITTLVDWFAKVAEVIVGVLAGALEWLGGALGTLGDTWSVIWNGAKAVFEGVWNGIVAFKDTIIMPVVNALGSIWDGLSGLWNSAFSTLKSIVKSAILGLLNAAQPVAYALDCVNVLSGEALLEGPIIRAKDAVAAWHSGGPISRGGMIGGDGELLLPLGRFKGGEWIIQESASRALGPDVMGMVNQGLLPVMADAGGPTLNIYVQNLYGQRDYVRLLAKDIVREMPSVEFGRWSRV